MAIIKKISAKTVCGDVKKIARDKLNDKVDRLPIMRVIGVARGMQTGETDNGPWVAFKGGFEATNLLSGESYRSGKLFLPDVAQDLVVEALESSEAVNLAFDITIIADDKSATGYVYAANPLMQVEENDPLEQLKKTLPKLPEPALLEKHAEETETQKKAKK